MERIWAPWRMEYICNSTAEGCCIFCPHTPEQSDRERLILTRSEHTQTMLNRYPYSGGHLMIAPLRHTAELDELSDNELLDLMHAVRRARSLLQRVMHPDGFNMGLNLGKVAGAGVEDHLHFHVVPRWSGDSNFMTVVGDVRVIPEALLSVYDHLSAALETEQGTLA